MEKKFLKRKKKKSIQSPYMPNMLFPTQLKPSIMLNDEIIPLVKDKTK